MPFMRNSWVVTFACISANSSFRGRRHADVAPELDPYWNYVKPELWPRSCKDGPQSPKEFLDFKTSTPETEKLLFQYRPIVNNVDIIHNTKSISLTLPELHGGFGLGPIFANLTAESEVFGFWQLALHHPSEHLFDGKEVPVELQLYHTRAHSDTCRQAIVAIGFDIEHRTTGPYIMGEPKSAFLDTLSRVLPPRAGRGNTNGAKLDVSELFVEPREDGTFVDASFVRYNGSNTIPPCANADVFVRTTAVQASFKAVERIQDTLVGNARKREGAPVQTRLYASENCAGQTAPAVTVNADEVPLTQGAATQISCLDASVIVEQFPTLRRGPLSKEQNPHELILYCTSVIAAAAEEEAMKSAYSKLKEEETAACKRAVDKSAMVRESPAANDQQEQIEANTLSITCEEQTNAVKAQEKLYDTVKNTRKKVEGAAKEQMQIAIGISQQADSALDSAATPAPAPGTIDIESLSRAPDGATSSADAKKVRMKRYITPEAPMVKDTNFKCNGEWPFGSAADTRSGGHAEGMVAKVVGDPRVALA